MTQSDPFWKAALVADEVIQEFQFTSLPIDPFAIARKRGIEVRAKPVSAKGVSGMFIRMGEQCGIAYATHIENEGFQRFSVAHELGHYFLPGHSDAILGPEGVHESHAGFGSGDRYELEADHFAAALLMPRNLVTTALRTAGEGLEAIERLSEACRTSLTATAIRFAQISSDPVAIVVSSGTRIEYCFMSDELKAVKGIDWIHKSQRVPPGTTTSVFNQSIDRVRGAERMEGTCELQDWFGGSRQIEISEDVVGLGSYEKTLTVLYGIDLPDEEEEEDEESLEDSWTPRFRR